jgi:predicted aldo/keto reductase-like oxidoreductase
VAEAFSAMSGAERRQWADELFVLGEPYCRECGYCLPCPGGMDLPAVLRMERTCSHYGIEEWIRPEEIGLIEVHPERCEGCGVCEARCPFDLPIRQMVASARQYRQPAAAA